MGDFDLIRRMDHPMKETLIKLGSSVASQLFGDHGNTWDPSKEGSSKYGGFAAKIVAKKEGMPPGI